MSEPRRHHIVPQFHLRRFADEDQRLTAVARDEARTFTSAVNSMMARRDFYAVETEEGWSQEVERTLSKIEGAASEAISRMLGGVFPPSEDDREVVALFISLQWLRGEDMRAGWNDVESKFHKFRMMNLSRAEIREGLLATEGAEPTDEEVDSMIEYFADGSNFDIEPHQNRNITHMLETAPGLSNIARGRTWQLLRAADGAFLTSDSPVVLWQAPANEHPFFGVGFGTADEVRLAIDRHHALVLAWEAPSGEVSRTISADHVRALNRQTAASAVRWIVHHPEDAPMDGIVLPPSRPKWSFDLPQKRIIPEEG